MSDDGFRIVNEFADVRVRKVLTGNGERCEIDAPRIGRKVLLDAVVLEALARQSPDQLSRFVAAVMSED